MAGGRLPSSETSPHRPRRPISRGSSHRHGEAGRTAASAARSAVCAACPPVLSRPERALGTKLRILLFCPRNMSARPVLSSPFLRTVLPRKLSASGAARFRIEEPVDALTPAKLLRALPMEDVFPPKSIDRRRLPRLIADELEAA